MNFTTLEAAHLAAHQLRLEGHPAEVLDECAGNLFGQLYPAGCRVVTESVDEGDGSELVESSADQPAQERECGPIGLGVWDFLVVCVLTATMLTLFFHIPTVLFAAVHGAPVLFIAKLLIYVALVGAVIGVVVTPVMGLGFWFISSLKRGDSAMTLLSILVAVLMVGALALVNLGF